MFGNGFRARVGAEFFAASSSEFQWYCLPSAYVVLHDSMLVRCAFVHYGRLARVHACVVLKGTTCSLSLSSGMPSLPLSCSGLSSSAMTPWMRKGEESDPNCHVHNRYGMQLGTKVPL